MDGLFVVSRLLQSTCIAGPAPPAPMRFCLSEVDQLFLTLRFAGLGLCHVATSNTSRSRRIIFRGVLVNDIWSGHGICQWFVENVGKPFACLLLEQQHTTAM